jgi:hypothetical protein
MWILYLELLLLLLVPFAVGGVVARFVVRVAVRRTGAEDRSTTEARS